jgi:N-acetylglucosaminyldiphosphoundecaprenol N-acetyl-beta-D-mannosaminyltransferase
MKRVIPTASILNVKVSSLEKPMVLAWIEKWIEKNQKKMVVTPNPEQVILAQKDLSFRKILNEAPLALADGVGLLWACRILDNSNQLEERVTGEEVMQELIKMAVEKGWRVFLLGGRKGVADRAADKLKIKNVKLKVKASSGALRIENETREERRKVIEEINKFKPDLLFAAFGAPWQEKWLAKNLPRLDVKVAMVVGGALDMVADPSLRPPQLMTKMGLDWFYRLVRQPWRVRRQLALLKFIFLVFKERLSEE